ncbi:MAG: hypothetical protein A2X55_01755 [Nitrospirae bacterium GWB2_47_37]|nr:MAG: hypothetical protein A2X55_01755 [Nitrospirae bacterium GWB2_47_37]
MKKTFVLDTNVLIHDPESIFKFEENNVIIPMPVIEELDKLKKGHGEIAYSARHALKNIDLLRERGNIAGGVLLETGGTVTVEYIPHLSDALSPDNKIITTAMRILESTNKDKYRPVILVSKDTAVRIKSESVGLYAEDYKNDKTAVFQQYGNVLGDNDYTNGILSVRYKHSMEDIHRIHGEDKRSRVKRGKSLENIIPKNIEQECAIDALVNPDIEVVALTGSAGTGKTVLALAAGVHQTTKKSPLYEQVLVARPVVPMGNDLGYLPGDIDEKLAPWMQPIFDNLEVIVNTPTGQFKDNTAISKYKNYQYLIESGILQIEALTYIRGRSLPKRYFIIDEAQNLRPLDVKTIITRCGEGTKIVFTGDLHQIDTPYLDAMSNGLAYLIGRFINEENFCYLNLKESVRSRLAEQGARLLQSFSGVSVNISKYIDK